MKSNPSRMYVPRELESQLLWRNDFYNLIALVGPRQAGKTTLLRYLGEGRRASYVLLDNPEDRELFETTITKFEQEYLEGRELAILDEVHQCVGAGRLLKYLVDSGRKLWVTASSETLLAKEVLSYLVGRVTLLRLYPFSFTEFLRAKGRKTALGNMLERLVWEQITYGGYPRVVTTPEPTVKIQLLEDLYQTMLLKDVAQTFNLGDQQTLHKLCRYLAHNLGGLVNYNSLASDLMLDFRTLRRYLHALEQSYLIYTVRPYFTNRAKELVKQPRVYFLDTGLRNGVARSFPTEPEGRVFENYIFCELLKLGYSPRYWRTKAKAEVDFIVERDHEIIPLEAKLSAPTHLSRSLRSFINTYQPQRAYVVFYRGQAKTLEVGECQVEFLNIAELVKGLGPSPIPRGIV